MKNLIIRWAVRQLGGNIGALPYEQLHAIGVNDVVAKADWLAPHEVAIVIRKVSTRN